MKPTPTPPHETDRNLLFGVLALQLDLIGPEQFAEACAAWAARKEVPLADLLTERGWVKPADRADVDRLMRRTLDAHGGDAHRSLVAVADGKALSTLEAVADFTVNSVPGGAPAADGELTTTAVRSPESLGRYTLLRLHDQGGLGRVWLARDDVLGREVALKELRPERAADPWFRARFLNEARITGQLEHPGIVTVHDLAQWPGTDRSFYTMRFVQGRTLTAAIRQYHSQRQTCQVGPLELTILLNAFVAVCNAVAYAHSRGVIHRDLKGHNVILGDYGEVVVLDWGLAKLVDPAEGSRPAPPVALQKAAGHEHTETGLQMGTPGYMAPEQAEGRHELVGIASDVYGLGAILYDILTGRPPFKDSGTTEAMRRLHQEEPTPPRRACPAVPPALEAICMKALARRPERRYATATELAREVQRWLADEPVSAYREHPSERLGRWARRHRSAAIVAAAALLAAVAALALSTFLIGRERSRAQAAYRSEADHRRSAEAAFRIARGGVDRLYYKALDDPLLNEPRMGPLRQDLIAAALNSYRELAEARPDDPGLRDHLGWSHLRYVRVALAQGAVARALDHGRQALAIFESLVREHPAHAVYLTGLASCHLDLAYAYREAHQMAAAEEAHRASVRIAQDLARTRKDGKSERLLAATYDGLGEVYRLTDQLGRAASAHGEALTLWESLTRGGDPSAPRDDLYHLASCRASLASILQRRGDRRQAEASFRRAEATLQRLIVDHPSAAYRNKLAYVSKDLGLLHAEAGDAAEAGRLLGRSLEIWRRLADDHPEVVEYRSNLAASHHHLGDLRRADAGPPGRPDSAASHYKEALATWEALRRRHPDLPRVRNECAKELFNLGEFHDAAGRPAEAEPYFREARDLWESLSGDERKEYERRYRARLQARLRGSKGSPPNPARGR
jgi:eukaryotic-like serine/threonine-protein kinase